MSVLSDLDMIVFSTIFFLYGLVLLFLYALALYTLIMMCFRRQDLCRVLAGFFARRVEQVPAPPGPSAPTSTSVETTEERRKQERRRQVKILTTLVPHKVS